MLLKPEIPQQVSFKLKAGQQKQADHYDKTAKPLPPLNCGDPVCVRQHYVVQESGGTKIIPGWVQRHSVLTQSPTYILGKQR